MRGNYQFRVDVEQARVLQLLRQGASREVVEQVIGMPTGELTRLVERCGPRRYSNRRWRKHALLAFCEAVLAAEAEATAELTIAARASNPASVLRFQASREARQAAAQEPAKPTLEELVERGEVPFAEAMDRVVAANRKFVQARLGL
jgi:hypothetical protein